MLTFVLLHDLHFDRLKFLRWCIHYFTRHRCGRLNVSGAWRLLLTHPRVGSHNAKLMAVVVCRPVLLDNRGGCLYILWSEVTSDACIIWITNAQFSPHALFIAHLLHFFFVLGYFFSSILLFDLGKKGVFHFLGLLLALGKNNDFFISALEDRAALFKFNIHSVFNDSSSCLHVWEILLSLNRAVNLRLSLVERLLHLLHWLNIVAAVLCTLLWDLSQCWLSLLGTKLPRFSWQWLVLIKSEWWQFRAQSHLVFKSLFVSHSDLLLQLVSPLSLLCILVLSLVLYHGCHVTADDLVLVVEMLLSTVNGCCSLVRMCSLGHCRWLLVVLKIQVAKLLNYFVVTSYVVRWFRKR